MFWNENPLVVQTIWFTDEAHVYLNGYCLAYFPNVELSNVRVVCVSVNLLY
jgi:hypothetical protein